MRNKFYHIILLICFQLINFPRNLYSTGKVLKGKVPGTVNTFTMGVDRGYKYVEKFQRCVNWFMMCSKDSLSENNFILRNETGELVSFSGQSMPFRILIGKCEIKQFCCF